MRQNSLSSFTFDVIIKERVLIMLSDERIGDKTYGLIMARLAANKIQNNQYPELDLRGKKKKQNE